MADPSHSHDNQQPQRAGRASPWRFLKYFAASAGTLLGTGGLAGLYAWLIEPQWIKIVRGPLPIANLPAGLAGRKLAVISDLHVGSTVSRPYLRKAIRLVNGLRADLLAICGDFMTADADEHVEAVVELLALLDRPPMGIVAVLGNHDYGHGSRRPETAGKLAARLGEIGVTVLRNELAILDGLHIVGLDDLWAHDGRIVPADELPGGGDFDMPAEHHRFTGPGRFFHPEKVLARLGGDAPAIVLAHNPDCVAFGDWCGYRGPVLAGHTHGGQVNLPLVGPPLLPMRDKRLVAGHYDLGDGRRLYINRGLGYLRRFRLGSRPEITLFTLKRT